MRRPDVVTRRTTVHRHDAARCPRVIFVHLHDQQPFAIGGRIRSVRHRMLMCRHVDVTPMETVFVGAHDHHVRALTDLGKQDPSWTCPDQP